MPKIPALKYQQDSQFAFILSSHSSLGWRTCWNYLFNYRVSVSERALIDSVAWWGAWLMGFELHWGGHGSFSPHKGNKGTRGHGGLHLNPLRSWVTHTHAHTHLTGRFWIRSMSKTSKHSAVQLISYAEFIKFSLKTDEGFCLLSKVRIT